MSKRFRQRYLKTLLLLLFFSLSITPGAGASELSGYLSGESRLFANPPLFTGQDRHDASAAFQPEFYHEWEGGHSFTAVPFVRLDSADSERTHFDIREFFGLWLFERFEVGVGIRKIFWGVTESQHLVDIINQTDLVESIDGEEKLGQPMVNLSIPHEWGALDLFILPWFRERTFPGREGRLRSSLVVDTDQTTYENGAEENHIDFAVRYSHTIGDWDIGLSHFRGTGRDPSLLPGTDSGGNPVLLPRYEQINQTGIDAQLITGEWLWKMEAIYRSGQGNSFAALTGGFEYTLVGIAGSRMDLGIISEWLYDDRGDGAPTPFENDIMAGMRLAVNDAEGTEALLGMIQDIGSSARFLSLESSRRFGDHLKTSLEIRLFLAQPPDDLLYDLRDDDLMRIEVAYYF
ncbi:MAG: hypothetical protein ACE5D4_00355 [Thermodesulfobacteriota bacterium]